ncbi:MAG: HAD family hydrolase [Candidatus Binatia bacterium]
MQALIAFDLDGVLYSSEPFLGEAYREAIANVNARRPNSFPRVPSTREILDHVGWPVTVILDRLFPDIDATAVDLLYAETLEVICAHVARREGILFPGVAETLADLRRSGRLLAVASNGRQRYIETVLSTYGIARHFLELITIESSAIENKAGLLRAYLERHGLAPARLVMVGDRSSDVEAAAAVGCYFIGCDYGHGYCDEIKGAGPIVSAFDQLPAAITAVLTAS